MNNATLIKTKDNLILVNEDKQSKGDNIVHKTFYEGVVKCPDEFSSTQEHWFKVIAQHPQIKLSKELAEKIGWVDIEDLATNLEWTVGNDGISSSDSFIKGFQLAQSLNKKLYNEEDMWKCYVEGKKSGRSYKDDEFKNYILSLNQLKYYNHQHYKVTYTEDNGIFNVQ